MLIRDAVVIRLQGICSKLGIRYKELATRSGVTPLNGLQLNERKQTRFIHYHAKKALRRS